MMTAEDRRAELLLNAPGRQRNWYEVEDILKWERCKQRMEDRLHARRRERQAKTAPPPATSGNGWRIVTNPKTPHEALEQLARQIINASFHEAPLLSEWRFRWGDLAGLAGPLPVVGLCVPSAKLILVDEARVLDGAGNRRELLEILAHEITHALMPLGESHGANFKKTLKSVSDVILADDTKGVPAAAPVSREIPTGRTFAGRRVEWAGAGEWEFR